MPGGTAGPGGGTAGTQLRQHGPRDYAKGRNCVDAAAAPPVPVIDAGRLARLRDVLAGGHLALDADRRLAGGILKRWPWTASLVTSANEFHRRAAAWAVSGGTPGFPVPPAAGVIFAASGYPVGGGFHAAAALARPDALFAYLDADPAAVAYNQALLGAPDPLRVCGRRAPARDPGRLLAVPAVQAILDRGPVMVQLQLCAQWWPPEFAAQAVAGYARLLPPGSTLALSLGVPGGTSGAAELAAAVRRAGGILYSHTEDEVAGWFKAAGLVLTPAGITDVRGREMGWAAAEVSRQRPVARAAGAVALVP